MAKNLVIVESPSKSKTIEKYLGKDYKVVSSKGHIRDLAKSGTYGFGVDLLNNFKPNYVPVKGKKKMITELKKEVNKVDKVFLASDPDREGEAISFHLMDSLGLKDSDYERIIFNEITKNKVIDSFNNPRKIDFDLVHSQETRRILDRIIGFRLSKLMQSKTGGKSAGRVQSVALKLIVDREREIESFIPVEYWDINAHFNEFEAKLEKYKDDKIEIKSEKECNLILEKLSNAFMIEDINKSIKKKSSRMPFITSTMQQLASSKLYFNSKKTMMIAQKLYEGIKLSNETVGLITYMRTDSTRFSSEFIGSCFNYIENKYGSEYVGYVKKGKKKENVQDAHEAIRPTSIERDPISIKPFLSDDEYKLYSMIYYRSLASLMADSKVSKTSVIFDNNDYKFKATGQIITFDGYLKVYKGYEDSKDKILPSFDKYKSNIIVSNKIESLQHFTKPLPRFSEATLIKEMEELGIGRPSTYSSTMETLKNRNYVSVIEKRFHPSEIGIEITDKLQEFFQNIINVEYTANMEEELDLISEGKLVWYEILDKFYNDFAPLVQNAFDNMEKKELEKTGEKCPNCGSDMVIRNGRYGKFEACSNFPECKYIKQEKKEEKVICDCPNCDGKIIEKKTRKGKNFYGCNNYPKCKTAFWDMPIDKTCPECNSLLVENKKGIKCSNCDYVEKN